MYFCYSCEAQIEVHILNSIGILEYLRNKIEYKFIENGHPKSSGGYGSISHHLVVTRNTKDIQTVFELEQASLIEEGQEYVPSSSYVRIKHLCSDTWLHATNYAIDWSKGWAVGNSFRKFCVLIKGK